MKLSQCITFTAIAATILSTQTAADKKSKIYKSSPQDQYETVLAVQSKAGKASYVNEKVIRSPTYVATPYPDSRFVDNPMAKAGKEGSHKGVRNLDRYGTAVLVSDSKAGKEGSHHSAKYVSDQEDVDFFIGSPGEHEDTCTFPWPNCGKGLTCRNRVNGNPTCWKNGTCRPFGMKCSQDSNCCMHSYGRTEGKCARRARTF